MKTTNPRLIAFSIILIAFFASCSKSNPISYKTILLTDKTWKFDFYGLDENNDGVIDVSENAMQSCEADDVFTFNINGTGLFSRGTATCDVGEPATVNFNWSFFNNETELAIFAAPEKISKLDDTTLEVYYMDQNLQGESVKYIRRFKH